jgi:hypothetical protein
LLLLPCHGRSTAGSACRVCPAPSN